MVGLCLVISLLGCALNTLSPVGAYHLPEVVGPVRSAVDKGVLKREYSNRNDEDDEKAAIQNPQEINQNPSATHQSDEFSTNNGGVEGYNRPVGQGQPTGYQQQNPNYQQGQYQNYQQGGPQSGGYQQGGPQSGGYQQGGPQQGAPYYNAPHQEEPETVLYHDNHEELVKDKNEDELRKLIAKALKEMKDIAGKVMFWHHMAPQNNGDMQGFHNPPNYGQQYPPPYGSPPYGQPYPPNPQYQQPPNGNPPYSGPQNYNPNPQSQPPYGGIQNYNTNPQSPPPYGNPPYGAPPNYNTNPQTPYGNPPYGAPPNYNTNPQTSYGNQFPSYGNSPPYSQPPQYQSNQPPPFVNNNFQPPQQQFQAPPQSYGNPMYQNPFTQPQFNSQSQSPIVIPPGTIQYQKIVQYLYGHLQGFPVQPAVDQQLYTLKLSSTPQQAGTLEQPASDPLSVPETLVKSVVQTLPPLGVPVLPPLLHPVVHVPAGLVVVAPTPVVKPPEVSLYKSHVQYGFPVLVHSSPQ